MLPYLFNIWKYEEKLSKGRSKKGKKIVNVLEREKSFTMGDHSSEIIKKVNFLLYLNTTFASFRLPVIPEKFYQKSTQIQQNDFC